MNYLDFVDKYRTEEINKKKDLIFYSKIKFNITKKYNLHPDFQIYKLNFDDPSNFIKSKDLIKYKDILFIYGAGWNFTSGGGQASLVNLYKPFSQNLAGIRTTKYSGSSVRNLLPGEFNGIKISDKLTKKINTKSNDILFSDVEPYENIYLFSLVNIDINFIKYKLYLKKYKGIVFLDRIGEGIADLPNNAPVFYKYLSLSLLKLKNQLIKLSQIKKIVDLNID